MKYTYFLMYMVHALFEIYAKATMCYDIYTLTVFINVQVIDDFIRIIFNNIPGIRLYCLGNKEL